MNKFILHDHVSGEFWDSYSMGDLKKVIEDKMDMGADVEDFQVYKASPLDIISYTKDYRELIIGEYNINPSTEAAFNKSI